MTKIKSFDSNLLSIDKISNKNTDVVVCNVKYIIYQVLEIYRKLWNKIKNQTFLYQLSIRKIL